MLYDNGWWYSPGLPSVGSRERQILLNHSSQSTGPRSLSRCICWTLHNRDGRRYSSLYDDRW